MNKLLQLAIKAGLKKDPSSDREYIGDMDWRHFAVLILEECSEVIDKHPEPVYDGFFLRKHFYE